MLILAAGPTADLKVAALTVATPSITGLTTYLPLADTAAWIAGFALADRILTAAGQPIALGNTLASRQP